MQNTSSVILGVLLLFAIVGWVLFLYQTFKKTDCDKKCPLTEEACLTKYPCEQANCPPPTPCPQCPGEEQPPPPGNNEPPSSEYNLPAGWRRYGQGITPLNGSELEGNVPWYGVTKDIIPGVTDTLEGALEYVISQQGKVLMFPTTSVDKNRYFYYTKNVTSLGTPNGNPGWETFTNL